MFTLESTLLSKKNTLLRKKIVFLQKFFESDLADEQWKEYFACFASIIMRKLYGKNNIEEYFVFLVRKNSKISHSLRVKCQNQIFKIEQILDHLYQNNFLVIITQKI